MSGTGLDLSQSEVHEIGHERTKIVRVENVLKDPERVRAAANGSEFAQINPHYPGIRAAVDQDFLQSLCEAVSELAATQLGVSTTKWQGQAWYSIVTQSPQSLAPIQTLPHFDGFDENQLAIMIYLNRTKHGGTAFFRHKSTGFERVFEARYPEYKTGLEADIKSSGLPPRRYISDGAPHFEKTSDFGAEYNSMILYPGTALHSGMIDNEQLLSANPLEGRLTINGFFRPV